MLMATALGVLVVQAVLFLVQLGGGSVLAWMVVAAQFGAFAASWWAVHRISRGSGGDGLKILAYTGGLFAVFGPAMVGGVIKWVRLPDCADASNAIASGGLDVVDRLLTAVIAGLVLAALLHARVKQENESVFHVPSGWSVALLAVMFAFFCNFASLSYRLVASVEPWCEGITGSALPSGVGTAVSVVSGFQEEFAFTGFALALFLSSRWHTLGVVVAINMLCRFVLHMYYADHQSVWWWLGWVVIWSGGGLVAAIAVGRQALNRSMPTTSLVAAYSIGAAVAHSAYNLSPAIMKLIGGPVLLAVVMMLVGDGSRPWHALWWLAPAQQRRSNEPQTQSNRSRG
ncbi:hypothetical protein A5742_17305 [Mycolicibacterium fortuitum]|uniref:Uncharacterized protein n=2 Tax=Mycolicibacterium fortuitum TaxID=1766 RepID=A0ABD6QTS0_MYCFO|nr:hypothetical protein A5742_17305 [Mycolicibacterium fortuitum]